MKIILKINYLCFFVNSLVDQIHQLKDFEISKFKKQAYSK